MWEWIALERCATGMADEMGLVFQGIYEWRDVGVARKLFGNGCAWVHAMREQAGELLKPMARVAQMIERHLEGILAHWTGGRTTAFMEWLNSMFSVVKRNARRYRAVEHMTAMLYFVAVKLTLPRY
jgi:transposase